MKYAVVVQMAKMESYLQKHGPRHKQQQAQQDLTDIIWVECLFVWLAG